jgi:photosystem II stability/assembly factor-like uncharacterized protein
MKRVRLLLRFVLFALILTLGTAGALVAGETQGYALASLSGVHVGAVASGADGRVSYAALTGGPQPAGVYRSEDGGISWKVVSSGPGSAINALSVHPLDADTVYAGTAGGAFQTSASLWRSDTGGQTWRRFTVGIPADSYGQVPAVTALAVDVTRPDTLYVGTDGQGVYRFEVRRNAYESYALVGGLSLYDAHVRGLVSAPNGRLYALTNDGAFYSDGGAWQQLQSVPELPVSLAVAADDPSLLYVGGTSTGVYRSLDAGQTWERVTNGIEILPGAALQVTALSVDQADRAHVVAASALGLGGRLVGDAIYESRNAGASWEKVADVQGVVTQLTTDQGVTYAASGSGLARYGGPASGSTQVLARPWRWEGLVNPTGAQVLILVLTVAMAGLALSWRKDWLLRRCKAAC